MSRVSRGAAAVAAALVLSIVAVCARHEPAPSARASTLQASSFATVVGSVVDAALTPIAGATVSLQAADAVPLGAATGKDGVFRFDCVAAGTYTLRADASGFVSISRSIAVPAGRETVRLPIVLVKPGDTTPKAEPTDSALNRAAAPTAAPMPTALPPPTSPTATTGERSYGGVAGGGAAGRVGGSGMTSQSMPSPDIYWPDPRPRPSGERYPHLAPNRFHRTIDDPLSTFGADVDTASYANVRRMLSAGQLPPSDAVRIEEFVNYFRMPYPGPGNGRPIGLVTEIGDCPWAPSHKLVLVGARARTSAPRESEGRNIVLLIDVSGSMAPVERLPLIKSALQLFVDTLQPDDRLAIVTYAGTSGVAMPSTPARRRDEIRQAIARLEAGGSTNGGQGLILAYRLARENYIPGGVNRVMLATDGDFNVGVTSHDDLLRLIEREKESGVFLSVFGVGSGNLKDATMEMLADRGNGHYAYLDTMQEARRILVRESDSTLETVAKDVKFQIEFNPALVAAWKQIGYEDRALAAEDFNDDRKDGGELGAGHTVTVLYEIVPVGVDVDDAHDGVRPAVDPLKYQTSGPAARDEVRPRPPAAAGDEWLTVKARYKAPEGERSDVIAVALRANGRPTFLPLSSAVAEFGLLLRDRSHDNARWDALARRIDRLTPPASLVAETRELQELIAIARGLVR